MSYGRRGHQDWEPEYDPLAEFDDLGDLEEPVPPIDSNPNVANDSAARGEPAVAVHLTDAGDVTAVVLAEEWRRSVDPRELGAAVLSAFTTATMQVLANQAEGVVRKASPPEAGAAADVPDVSPLRKEDVMRLLDAVSADLHHFTEQLSARVEHTVSVESSGGHVRGSARSGQILDAWVDPGWASSARNSEIELELVEVLKRLRDRSAPGELMQGPRSRAIDELLALARDPQSLLRRVGLQP